MELEILNNFQGDNLVQIDTNSEDGKKKIAELVGSENVRRADKPVEK